METLKGLPIKGSSFLIPSSQVHIINLIPNKSTIVSKEYSILITVIYINYLYILFYMFLYIIFKL